jgi:hypothetical protein
MDYIVYNRAEYNQAILIWFRESSSQLTLYNQMPISVLTYAYIFIEDIKDTNDLVKQTNYESVEKTIKMISKNSQTLFSLICCDFDSDVLWFEDGSSIIGFANTHRSTKDHVAIWEVVFAANIVQPYFEQLQKHIEAAAKKLPCYKGLLFVTNGLSRGNLAKPDYPWSSGNSGYLTTHVYNWMPPRFFDGDIFFPFSCI